MVISISVVRCTPLRCETSVCFHWIFCSIVVDWITRFSPSVSNETRTVQDADVTDYCFDLRMWEDFIVSFIRFAHQWTEPFHRCCLDSGLCSTEEISLLCILNRMLKFTIRTENILNLMESPVIVIIIILITAQPVVCVYNEHFITKWTCTFLFQKFQWCKIDFKQFHKRSQMKWIT